MKANPKKLLVLSISLILSSTVLTACGDSSSQNVNDSARVDDQNNIKHVGGSDSQDHNNNSGSTSGGVDSGTGSSGSGGTTSGGTDSGTGSSGSSGTTSGGTDSGTGSSGSSGTTSGGTDSGTGSSGSSGTTSGGTDGGTGSSGSGGTTSGGTDSGTGSSGSSGTTSGGTDSGTGSTDGSATNPSESKQIFNVQEFASNANFSPITVAHWKATPVLPSRENKFDERIRNIQVVNGKVNTRTIWHNSIIRFDETQTTDTQITPTYFSALLTADKKEKSSDDDIISGATEHRLTDVAYSKDGKTMYASVVAKKIRSSDDDTYGLFKVPLNADGSIPDFQVKGKPAPQRANGVERVYDQTIYGVLPLDNGVILADIYNRGSKEIIAYYDADLKLQEDKSFELPEDTELYSWSSDKNAVYLLLGTEKNNQTTYQIEKRLLTNLTNAEKTKAMVNVRTLYKTPNGLVIVSQDSVQLADDDLNIISTVMIDGSIEQTSLSTDEQRLAVVTESGKLRLIDIDNKKLSNPVEVNLNDDVKLYRIAMGNKNNLFYTQYSDDETTGFIKKINLNQPLIKLTDKQVVQHKLDKITESSIHKRQVDVNSYNLNLPKVDNSLSKSILYTWTSSNPSVISNEGEVTVPTSGDPVTVTMTVTAKVLGSDELTTTKSIDVVIKPNASVIDTGVESDLNEKLARDYFNDGISQYFNNTANDDGSLYTLLNTGGIAILQKQDNNQLDVALANDDKKLFMPQVDSSSGVNLTKPKVLTAMWEGNNTLFVLLGGEQSGALVKKEFTDINNASSIAEQAKQPWSVVRAFTKPVIQGYVDDDRHYITIVEDNGEQIAQTDKRYQVTTISAKSTKQRGNYGIDVDLSKNYAFVGDKGKYIWVSDEDNHKLTRYVEGVQDSELDTDGKYYSSVFIKDNMVLSGRSGNLLFVKDALQKAPVTQQQVKQMTLDRGNGSKDRVYGLTRIDKKLYASQKRLGVSVIDISNFDEPVTSKFIPYDDQYVSVASGNGKYLLQIGYKTSKFKLTPFD